MDLTQDALNKKLKLHTLWLRGEVGGERFNGAGLDLRDANLEGANLKDTNLEGASLEGANLQYANLECAYLRCANLLYANLEGADLRCADLKGVNLVGANLKGANLERASLRGANLRCCIGGGKRITTYSKGSYTINILDQDIVWGGCTKKTLSEWLEYTGEGDDLSNDDLTYLNTVTKPYLKKMQLEFNQSK